MSKRIELGDVVKDGYTGFEGIAVCRTEWLYGCARIGIEPVTLDKDGKKREPEYFDEQRVQLVARKPRIDASEGAVTTGGDCYPDAPRGR